MDMIGRDRSVFCSEGFLVLRTCLLRGIVCSLLFSLSTQVQARFFRVGLIPNGPVYSCSTCHDSGGGGPRNSFGYAVEEVAIGSRPFWDAALAALDSDLDGFSNGEELGDPDGDGLVDPMLAVSNPGDPLSFPVTPPSLRWVAKPKKDIFWVGEIISVEVEASDDEGVQLVLFEWSRPGQGDVSAFTVVDRQPPYRSGWSLQHGAWRLTVSALDSVGAASYLPAYDVSVRVPDPLVIELLPAPLAGNGARRILWRGGKGPFQVQRARRLASAVPAWESLSTTPASEYLWTPDLEISFFRILDLGQVSP